MADENDWLASELAARYALGGLTGEERRGVEERLRSGDVALEQELRRYQEMAAQLALAARPVRPPPSLKERLAARTRPAPHEPESAVLFEEGGVLLSTAARLPWKRTPLPGVWTKTLFVDRKRGYRTSLVRLEPGAEYPSHRHADVEELFVLEGEMEIHGHTVGPGGYCRAEPNSVHRPGRTATGAVFLAVASVRDELLL